MANEPDAVRWQSTPHRVFAAGAEFSQDEPVSAQTMFHTTNAVPVRQRELRERAPGN